MIQDHQQQKLVSLQMVFPELNKHSSVLTTVPIEMFIPLHYLLYQPIYTHFSASLKVALQQCYLPVPLAVL